MATGTGVPTRYALGTLSIVGTRANVITCLREYFQVGSYESGALSYCKAHNAEDKTSIGLSCPEGKYGCLGTFDIEADQVARSHIDFGDGHHVVEGTG